MTDLNNAETQTDAPCSAINYCNLNGYELTAEEKIIFLSSYVSRIDNETVYQPATREFVQNFNVDAAISIINNYATAVIFSRSCFVLAAFSDAKASALFVSFAICAFACASCTLNASISISGLESSPDPFGSS